VSRPTLTIDDPLAPHHEPEARPVVPVEATASARPARSSATPTTTQTGQEPWREWSGDERVASFRLPAALLDELGERAGALGLPLGLTVAAALSHLLDLGDERVVDLVDRADDARHRGRRRRRRLL
jgi:hypothetical protein